MMAEETLFRPRFDQLAGLWSRVAMDFRALSITSNADLDEGLAAPPPGNRSEMDGGSLANL